MKGLAAAVVLVAVLLGVLLAVAFDLFCLVRLVARDDRGLLPKLAWAVAIVCISPFGGLVYVLSDEVMARRVCGCRVTQLLTHMAKATVSRGLIGL